MTLWLNTTIDSSCSIWTLPFKQAPFKYLISFSAFSQ